MEGKAAGDGGRTATLDDQRNLPSVRFGRYGTLTPAALPYQPTSGAQRRPEVAALRPARRRASVRGACQPDVSSAGLDWRAVAANAITTAPCCKPAGPPGLAHCTNRRAAIRSCRPATCPRACPGSAARGRRARNTRLPRTPEGHEALGRGTFLDGANNASMWHCTPLERCLGWRGVLAEGHLALRPGQEPAAFAQLGMAVCPTHTTANFQARERHPASFAKIDGTTYAASASQQRANATIPVPCAIGTGSACCASATSTSSR